MKEFSKETSTRYLKKESVIRHIKTSMTLIKKNGMKMHMISLMIKLLTQLKRNDFDFGRFQTFLKDKLFVIYAFSLVIQEMNALKMHFYAYFVVQLLT